MFIKRAAVLLILIIFISFGAYSQFRIRLLADESSDVVIFTVVEGTYQIIPVAGRTVNVPAGESVILTRISDRLTVKARNGIGFSCDSTELRMVGEESKFSIRTQSGSSLKRVYNGNLICKSDLESVFLINTPVISDYIAGVVKAEGGNGGSLAYFKTQAVIARTYSYKYENKHAGDKFNLCDGIHCQVYHGLTTDQLITSAVAETDGEVITDKDSVLIIAAFHSNCGGETVASGDLWLADQPYLKRVIDPYCLSSANAKWETTISRSEWISYLEKNGFKGETSDPSLFSFVQNTRKVNYNAGTYSYPLNNMRNDFQLKSTFFSVSATEENMLLKGKGYGHGVGLCQEGAMNMAKLGNDYKQIIDFYYTGVGILNINETKRESDR